MNLRTYENTMQFPADNYPVVFWNSSSMRTHIMHIPLENAVGKKRTGNGGLCFNILSCGKFLKGRACQSVIPPPHFCTLGPLLIWRSLKWEAMCGWCGVFIPFSPFFMFGLMLLLRGSLPSPPPSPPIRWVTRLLLAQTALSQQSLQLLLHVYLGDCVLNACLFHLTIWMVGVGGPCVYCPMLSACHGVWHIVGANVLNE